MLFPEKKGKDLMEVLKKYAKFIVPAALLLVALVHFIIDEDLIGEYNEAKAEADEAVLITEVIDTELTSGDVTGLQITGGSCYVSLIKEETETVQLDLSEIPEGYTWALQDGTLVLDMTDKKDQNRHIHLSGASTGAVLRLPMDISLTNITIDLRSGNIYFSNVDAGSITLNAGSGNFHNLGYISGDFTFVTGSGNAELRLRGSETDYNYDLYADFGNIDVGYSVHLSETSRSSGQTGLKSKYTHTNQYDGKKIRIETGNGNIKIEF